MQRYFCPTLAREDDCGKGNASVLGPGQTMRSNDINLLPGAALRWALALC
jgi:hypothetical protein